MQILIFQPNLLRFIALVSVLYLIFTSAVFAQLYSVDIRRIDPDSPVRGTIHVLSLETQGSRQIAQLRIDAPRFFDEADTIARAEGNLGSSRNRIFWVGQTRFLRANRDGAFVVRSRVRYESWTYVELGFDTIKTRNFRDTKTVDINIVPVYELNERWVALDWRISNIHNFPGELEQLLRGWGVDFDGRATTYIEDMRLARAVDLRVNSLAAQGINGGAGLAINVTLSFDSAAALRTGATSFISRRPGNSGFSLLPRIFGGRG